MKKLKTTAFLAFAALNGALLSAAPSASGVAAGSLGIDGKYNIKEKSTDWTVPIALFGALQVDFNEWATAHAEIEMHAKDFPAYDIFDGSEGIFKVHELSAVFSRRATTATHYFSAYLGSYEPIGCDTFLMRQFGIEPISSRLTKSVTNIAGVPLYASSGGGLSYIVHLDKKPISTGAYLYFCNDDNDKFSTNADFRFAISKKAFTLDFAAGFGVPVRDKDEDSGDYIIAIKTITFHGGINMLLGNKYGHGLLFQLGLNNLVLSGNNSFSLENDNLSFVIEPRIKFDKWGFNATIYALDQKVVDNLLYLTDKIGIGATYYNESFETSNGTLTMGIHFVISISDIMIMDFFRGKNIGDISYNTYLTPYIELPISSTAKVEFMGQVGLLNFTSSPIVDFKVVAGFRKQF